MQPAIKSSIPRKLCSLNREKAKLKSGTSLLLITNFIYLIKFNLVLINLRKSWPHTKFFSQCSFCTNLLSLSGSILTCPIFSPSTYSWLENKIILLSLVRRAYAPRFFVSSQQKFGVTHIKALWVGHSSRVLDRPCYSSQVSNGPCYSS